MIEYTKNVEVIYKQCTLGITYNASEHIVFLDIL